MHICFHVTFHFVAVASPWLLILSSKPQPSISFFFLYLQTLENFTSLPGRQLSPDNLSCTCLIIILYTDFRKANKTCLNTGDKENNPVKKSLLLSFYFFSIYTLNKDYSNIFCVMNFWANSEQVPLQDLNQVWNYQIELLPVKKIETISLE